MGSRKMILFLILFFFTFMTPRETRLNVPGRTNNLLTRKKTQITWLLYSLILYPATHARRQRAYIYIPIRSLDEVRRWKKASGYLRFTDAQRN